MWPHLGHPRELATPEEFGVVQKTKTNSKNKLSKTRRGNQGLVTNKFQTSNSKNLPE